MNNHFFIIRKLSYLPWFIQVRHLRTISWADGKILVSYFSGLSRFGTWKQFFAQNRNIFQLCG